jgi:hypothetical protein
MTSMRLKHYDPPLNVFTNPTRDEAVDLLNKTKIGELRAIQDPKSGNLHVWDAYRAVHEQIANELGLNYDELFDLLGRNGTGLHLFDNADQIKSFPYKVFKGDLPDK